MIFQFDYIEPEPETVLDKPPAGPDVGMKVDVEGPPGIVTHGTIITAVAQDHGPGQEAVTILSINVDNHQPGARELMEFLIGNGEVAIKVLDPQAQHA